MTTETVDPTTGEVMAVAKYDPRAYLATLAKHDGLSVQRELAAAYDAAVVALIGPNDVQEDGGRSFKKKSAWRKLARYFGISVEIVDIKHDTLVVGDLSYFLATVTARAVAPWGQRYEEVGSCCTDEAVGRRVITVADAIATASTRASNRAISNLIAMGEVSAEEVGDRGATDAPRANGVKPVVMAFGSTKGTPLDKVKVEEIQSAIAWAESKNKFTDWVKQARQHLESRGVRNIPETAGVAAGEGDDSDLPF